MEMKLKNVKMQSLKELFLPHHMLLVTFAVERYLSRVKVKLCLHKVKILTNKVLKHNHSKKMNETIKCRQRLLEAKN